MSKSVEQYAKLLVENIPHSGFDGIANRFCSMLIDAHEAETTTGSNKTPYSVKQLREILALMLEILDSK